MRDIIKTTEVIKDDAKFKEHGVTAVGALGSFLVGTATAGLGLAAAGFFVSPEVKDGADQIDDVQDIAEQRRSFMVGIYNAKQCDGSIEQAMAEIEKKSMLDITAQKLASVQPAAGKGKDKETPDNAFNLNE
jgi:hypothetical protein